MGEKKTQQEENEGTLVGEKMRALEKNKNTIRRNDEAILAGNLQQQYLKDTAVTEGDEITITYSGTHDAKKPDHQLKKVEEEQREENNSVEKQMESETEVISLPQSFLENTNTDDGWTIVKNRKPKQAKTFQNDWRAAYPKNYRRVVGVWKNATKADNLGGDQPRIQEQ